MVFVVCKGKMKERCACYLMAQSVIGTGVQEALCLNDVRQHYWGISASFSSLFPGSNSKSAKSERYTELPYFQWPLWSWAHEGTLLVVNQYIKLIVMTGTWDFVQHPNPFSNWFHWWHAKLQVPFVADVFMLFKKAKQKNKKPRVIKNNRNPQPSLLCWKLHLFYIQYI